MSEAKTLPIRLKLLPALAARECMQSEVALLLCGIHEHRRLHLHGPADQKRRRTAVCLSRLPWFAERLKFAGLGEFDHAGHRQSKMPSCVFTEAVLIVAAGSCYSGALHCWSADEEAQLQWQYNGQVEDAISILIDVVWLVEQPCQ